jgi:hypothetical protein
MRKKLLLAPLALSLLLTACGQSATSPPPTLSETGVVALADTSTPVPEPPTDTPAMEPTDTPTPKPTHTPTSTPSPSPTNTPRPTPTPTPKPTNTPKPTSTPTPTPTDVALTCEKEEIFTVSNTKIWTLPGHDAFFFKAGMQIDADGAPDAYHGDNIGTDDLANAGRPGNWWALVTDTGQPDGTPIVQGPDDPSPGYYVSITALEDRTKDRTDPRRYVNSNEILFVVLPYDQRGGASLGDFSVVMNQANGKLAYAIFADLGPGGVIGEGSIALAKALHINDDPRIGGQDDDVVYILFPNSGNGKPRSIAEINAEAERLFNAWGGIKQLEACFPE